MERDRRRLPDGRSAREAFAEERGHLRPVPAHEPESCRTLARVADKFGHVRFTPSSRHHGRDAAILAKRRTVYAAARRRSPGRWSGDVRDCERAGPVSLNPQRPDVVKSTTNEVAA